MSSDESHRPGPVLPSGYYHLKYGVNPGIGGAYLTAGKPGTRATIQALAPQPLGKTQRFKVTYNKKTKKYTLKSDAQHGISYTKRVDHGPIITSTGKPHAFKITLAKNAAPHPPSLKLYRIGIRLPSHVVVVGQAKMTIFPPQLALEPVTPQNVWQFKRVLPHAEEDVVDDDDDDDDDEQEEELSDEEFSDELEE